jgi:hypothetical protein
MTQRETERHQRARDLEERRRERALDPILTRPDQVLTFRQWCRLNGISERTGARILAGPDGPVVVRLSAKRLGITVRANLEWQQSRVRINPPAA